MELAIKYECIYTSIQCGNSIPIMCKGTPTIVYCRFQKLLVGYDYTSLDNHMKLMTLLNTQ